MIPLDQITPAPSALAATPADFLSVAFPEHGRTIDPDRDGVWIKHSWFPAALVPATPPAPAPAPSARVDVNLTLLDPLDVVEQHLDMDDVPDVHPQDLPPCLPTRREQLDDVMHHPATEIAAAIWATGSAEPGSCSAR
nr:hypothetical protein GCM10025730_06270 [Promicromonospora thailandica]